MSKVFIAAPIRDTKEYAVPRWLESIKAEGYPDSQIYMVDNSDLTTFSDRVNTKVSDIDLKNVTLVKLPDMGGRESEARLVLARENFREAFLHTDTEYWMSWECDILLPAGTIQAMIDLMDLTKADIVTHDYPDRDNKLLRAGGIGCSLFKRSVLEKISFAQDGGWGRCDPLVPNCFYSGDSYFMTLTIREGFKRIDLSKFFDVQHLGQMD